MEDNRTDTPLRAEFRRLQEALAEACQEVYGIRLISVVVFGSVGRSVMRPDSDIDVLLVVDPLPSGRIPRVREFDEVERRMAPHLQAARQLGIQTRLSPVLKTPAEVQRGSPLFLDFVDDARMLFDRNGFFAQALDALRARLASLGARRVWKGSAWYWDLKPDYKPGDVIEF